MQAANVYDAALQLLSSLHADLLRLCREVADSSRGVAAALQAVAHYQRRSDAVLVHLLGRSYGTCCDMLVSCRFRCL
jgi:hypothetical protein